MPLPSALKQKLLRSPLAGVAEIPLPERAPDPPTERETVQDRASDLAPIEDGQQRKRKRGPKCRVCNHPHRAEIEQFCLENRSMRWIADQIIIRNWEPVVREGNIDRHFRDCLPGSLTQAVGVDRSAKAFLEKIEDMAKRIQGWLDEFECGGHICSRCLEADEQAAPGRPESKDWRAGAAIVRELRSIVELQGKVLGHLRPDVELTIINHPQFNATVMPICEITAACRTCGPKVARILDVGGG